MRSRPRNAPSADTRTADASRVARSGHRWAATIAMLFALACATALPLPAAAQANAANAAAVDPRPRLNLDAAAYRDVVQDRIIVTLYAERESPQPAAGQAQVSALLNPVLERLRSHPELEVESTGYRTDPVWQQSRIVGWRTRASVQITASPSAEFNRLIGELATTLNIQSVAHTLSRDARIAVEHELITEAIEAFHAKARTAAKALGFGSYEIREISIGGSGHFPPQPVPRMMARAASSDEAVPLPTSEGKTTVTTTVNGSVALVR